MEGLLTALMDLGRADAATTLQEALSLASGVAPGNAGSLPASALTLSASAGMQT